MERICKKCNANLPVTLFRAPGRPRFDGEDRLSEFCAFCRKRKPVVNPIKLNRDLLWQQVLNLHGNKCECCSESNSLFLTLDHVKNDGAFERRKYNQITILLRALRPISAADYQVLCMNCNWAKGRYGKCPHKQSQ